MSEPTGHPEPRYANPQWQTEYAKFIATCPKDLPTVSVESFYLFVQWFFPEVLDSDEGATFTREQMMRAVIKAAAFDGALDHAQKHMYYNAVSTRLQNAWSAIGQVKTEIECAMKYPEVREETLRAAEKHLARIEEHLSGLLQSQVVKENNRLRKQIIGLKREQVKLKLTRTPRSKVTEDARQWQPIETAPRDGSEVLLYDRVCRVQRVAVWVRSQQMWFTDQGRGGYWNSDFSHWMPLPEPPQMGPEP